MRVGPKCDLTNEMPAKDASKITKGLNLIEARLFEQQTPPFINHSLPDG